ncbi:MAG: DNA repair exonuclease [Clostridia bacterium]|nr:DNA repair exonuclease [Clostridia bacterium]
MKFIHCADLHLDTAFKGLNNSKSASVRQAELRRTFLSIVELAKSADALLIAGDLFDQRTVEAETIHMLRQAFASLENTKVLIVAGNHDPLTEKSFYKLAGFSDNVHIFGHELGMVTVADCDVYGISFSHAVQDTPLLESFSTSQSRPAVLLMHGDLGGTTYNPIQKDAVKNSTISYLALGHVHNYKEEKIGTTHCAYPGCPEGRGFDELGDKGIIRGEVTEKGVITEFVSVCSRRYHEVTVDVSGLLTHEMILDAMRSESLNTGDLYKIILTGETELVPDPDVLSEALNECFFAKVYDETRRPLNLDALKKEAGVRSMLIEALEAGLTGEQSELYRKALEYGLAALDGKKVKSL